MRACGGGLGLVVVVVVVDVAGARSGALDKSEREWGRAGCYFRDGMSKRAAGLLV